MPPKRRTTKRKAAQPAEPEIVEETVVEEVKEVEPVPEPEPETTAEDLDETTAEDGDEEEDEAEPKKPLTAEEKVAQLDRLSKAHPFGLLANLCKLTNKYKPYFNIKKNEAAEGEDKEKFEKSMTVIARFGELKITIPAVAGDNFKFAKKVSADLILHQLYGDDHEMDAETAAIMESGTVEIGSDPEWYAEKKAIYEKFCNNKVDRIVTRVNANDKYDEEEKKTKIAKFESWRTCTETVLDYDEVYRHFDHPYYRVMHNVLTMAKGMKYETTLFKYEGENEVEIPLAGKGGKRTHEEREASMESESAEGTTKFKVCIKVFKDNDVCLELEHVDETSKLREAKSEAAYKILEKLLSDGTIGAVNRRHLRNQNERNNFSGRFGGRGNFRGGYRGRGNFRGRGGSRGGSRGGRGNSRGASRGRGQNKGGNRPNPNQSPNKVAPQQMMQPNYSMGGMGGMPGQSMMMMPVMMGPNGQMMIASNAQPMMMMPQQQQQVQMTGTAPSKPTRGKKKGNRGKRVKKE